MKTYVMSNALILRDKYIFDSKFRSKEEFLDIYKYPFLVQYGEPSDAQKKERALFATMTAPNLEDIIKGNKPLYNNQKEIRLIYPVTKTDKNPFASKVTIGRTSAQDINIEDLTISKFHAYLEWDDDKQYYLIDGNSTNGTSLNGNRIEPNTPILLKNGDRIGFSSYEFIFYDTEKAFDTFREAKE